MFSHHNIGGQIKFGSDIGSWSTSNTGFIGVTNGSVTISVSGQRPLLIGLISQNDATYPSAMVSIESTSSSTNGSGIFELRESSTVIYGCQIQDYGNTSDFLNMRVGPSAVWHIHMPTAGTHTYQLYGRCTATSMLLRVWYCKMFALEL